MSAPPAVEPDIFIRQEHLFFRAKDGTSCTAFVPRYIWEDDEEFHRNFSGRYTRWIEHEILSMGEDPEDYDIPRIAKGMDDEIDRLRPEWREIQDLVGLKEEHGVGQPARLLRMNTPPERDWFVYGLLARGGVTLVQGREKLSGKSTLIFQLVGALERNERTIFGPAYGRPVRTLIVTEEPEYALRDKAEKFNLRDAWIVEDWVWPLDKMPGGVVQKQWEFKLEQIERLAHAIGAEHVIIDPFSRIGQVEEEAGREPGMRAEAVSSMAYRGKLAVTIIHHNNKASDKAVEDRGRGSTSLQAAVEQIVQIDRVKDDDRDDGKKTRRREAVSWGRVEEADWSITFELADDGTSYRLIDVEAEGQLKKAAKEATAREKAEPDLQLLKSLPDESATVHQFTEALGLEYNNTVRQAVRARLEALADLHLAIRDMSGRERLYTAASEDAPQ
jgi:hypothetical protein